MKMVFADTVYFLALLNPADQWHKSAVAWTTRPGGKLLTTEFVLTEVGDALSRSDNHQKFASLLRLLRQQRDVEIAEATSRLFQEACDLHAARSDKDWSLTDCTSFVIMSEHGLTEALTTDHHFEQAGFKPVMRMPAGS